MQVPDDTNYVTTDTITQFPIYYVLLYETTAWHPPVELLYGCTPRPWRDILGHLYFARITLTFVSCIRPLLSFRPFHGPGVDSAPSVNEHQEHFLGVKAAGAWGWQPHHLHVPNVVKIWEPKPPRTVWATPGLLGTALPFFVRPLLGILPITLNCEPRRVSRASLAVVLTALRPGQGTNTSALSLDCNPGHDETLLLQTWRCNSRCWSSRRCLHPSTTIEQLEILLLWVFDHRRIPQSLLAVQLRLRIQQNVTHNSSTDIAVLLSFKITTAIFTNCNLQNWFHNRLYL
jgi:hypothetical protein